MLPSAIVDFVSVLCRFGIVSPFLLLGLLGVVIVFKKQKISKYKKLLSVTVLLCIFASIAIYCLITKDATDVIIPYSVVVINYLVVPLVVYIFIKDNEKHSNK